MRNGKSEADLERLERGLAQHADVAYRTCLRTMNGNAEDAADAFQDGCLRLIRSAKALERVQSLRAWICTHMHRAAVDLVRTRRHRELPMQRPHEERQDEEGGLLEQAERRQRINAVHQAVAALPALDRMAVELRYYENLTDREVAEVLGCREAAAGMRIRRALDNLRKALGRGVAVALLLALFGDIAKAEAEIKLPTELWDWMKSTFAAPPVQPMTVWDYLKEGVIKMARSPITYVAVVALCAVGFWLNSTRSRGGGEPTEGLVAAHAGKAKPFRSATEAEVKELATGDNAFASAMYAKLVEKEKGNLFFSPISIRSALAMTCVGAKGETAKQMRQVLRFTLKDDRLHAAFRSTLARLETDRGASRTLNIANSLWGQEGYKFLQTFLDTNATYYGGGLNTVNFKGATEQARQTINLWVENKTNKKIKDFISPDGITKLTRLVLVNAVYFSGYWDVEFDKKLTRDAPFYVSKDKQVTVKLMRHKTWEVKKKPRFRYMETDALQAVDLPYKGDKISMIVMLPKERDGLATLEATLTTKGLAKWLGDLDRAHKQDMSVFLPKFKLMWGTKDLGPSETNALPAMGMTDCFRKPWKPNPAPWSDLSGINGVKPPSTEALYISAVFHKAFVDVNEKGTEAAAATAVVVAPGAAPGPPTVFRADHPFLFLIRDNPTGSILFMGRLVDPPQ